MNLSSNEPLKKSTSSITEEKNNTFHQKMIRRRITTMLRPNVGTMLEEVKRLARTPKYLPRTMKDCFDVVPDNDDSLCQDLRLEQLLLLALHPTSQSPPLPPVPCQPASAQSWAEPGWPLIIDNHHTCHNQSSSSLIPIDTEGYLSQKFLSTCCSSGRQAASLIKPRHLRLLSDPTSQTSPPAETIASEQKESSRGKFFNRTFNITVFHSINLDKFLTLGLFSDCRPSRHHRRQTSPWVPIRRQAIR